MTEQLVLLYASLSSPLLFSSSHRLELVEDDRGSGKVGLNDAGHQNEEL